MRKFFRDRTSPNSAELADIYDSHAPTWLQRESRAENSMVSDGWRNRLASLLRGDVLEIGVAAGDTLLRLRERPHSVTSFTGIDLSPGMIQQARRAGEGADFPVTLLTMDAQDLSAFPDDSFDTVTASLVLCTIPDVPAALAEIARVSRPGASVVLIEHVLSPHGLIATGQRALAAWQIRHMGCHLDRTTVETLQAAGYSIEQHQQRLFGVFRFVVAHPPH